MNNVDANDSFIYSIRCSRGRIAYERPTCGQSGVKAEVRGIPRQECLLLPEGCVGAERRASSQESSLIGLG